MSKDTVSMNLRLPKDTHKSLKMFSEQDNRSLHNYILTVLEEHIDKQHDARESIILEEQMSYDSELTNEQMEAAIKAMYNLVKSSKGNKNTSNDK
jgi:hypothetical protein